MDYNFEIYDPDSIKKKVLQEFDLGDDDVREIQHLNIKIEVIKQMINDPKTTKIAVSKLVDELTLAQIKYKQWFFNMQIKFGIDEKNQNQLNVLFHKKKLQIIG